jgi:aminoglycoside phosphotransferase (APT) family kinase protein
VPGGVPGCLENVVLRDGRATGLIDFGLAASGRPLWDVAMTAHDTGASAAGPGLVESFRDGQATADHWRSAEGPRESYVKDGSVGPTG